MANPQDPAAQTAATDAVKAAAEAEKAAAEARKAQVDATLAALKAQLEVPSSGNRGAVELKDKAGAMEAALLSARATAIAARRIAAEVSRAIPTSVPDRENPEHRRPTQVLLFAAGDVPTFHALLAFRAQALTIEKAIANAVATSDALERPPGAPPGAKMLMPVAAAGLALDAMSKLAGYFATEYAVGNVELTAEDLSFVFALGRRLAKAFDVHLPAIYDAAALSAPPARMLQELEALTNAEVDAKRLAAHHESEAAQLDAAADKEPDEKRKGDLKALAAKHREAAKKLDAATALADGLFAKLGAADDKGATPLAAAAREASVHNALSEGGHLLVVKVHRVGGAYYTKRSLATVFGKMPFFHMGGVVAGYALLDGESGKVRATGIVPVHGGFVNAEDLENVAVEEEEPPAHVALLSGLATTKVTIKMTSGNVLCTGRVYRLVGGQPGTTVSNHVEVRRAKPSEAFRIDEPGHYQYAFRCQGGSGDYSLEAKDHADVVVGSSSYTGTPQTGLILDFYVP